MSRAMGAGRLGAAGIGRSALAFYGSVVGKKYVMAVTDVVLIQWIAAHTVGSLKMYLGEQPTDHYSEGFPRGC